MKPKITIEILWKTFLTDSTMPAQMYSYIYLIIILHAMYIHISFPGRSFTNQLYLSILNKQLFRCFTCSCFTAENHPVHMIHGGGWYFYPQVLCYNFCSNLQKPNVHIDISNIKSSVQTSSCLPISLHVCWLGIMPSNLCLYIEYHSSSINKWIISLLSLILQYLYYFLFCDLSHTFGDCSLHLMQEQTSQHVNYQIADIYIYMIPKLNHHYPYRWPSAWGC